MSKRIYIVEAKGSQGPQSRLVDASTQAQAIRHVVGATFEARVASAREVAEMVQAGLKVEAAVEKGA